MTDPALVLVNNLYNLEAVLGCHGFKLSADIHRLTVFDQLPLSGFSAE